MIVGIEPRRQGLSRGARAGAHRIWFSSKLFEKLSPEPKNGLESCVSRFSTICAKNLVLKLKIDKVTVIRVTKSPSGYPPL
jgi:hypothetical protein